MNEILKIPFAAFVNDWDDLQLFLKHKGNPPYEITDDFKDYMGSRIQSLGNLTSVGGSLNLSGTQIKSLGNLTLVRGNLDLRDTPLSKKYIKEEIESMVKVGGSVYL